MNSYVFDIGERARKVSRALGKLHSALQAAFIAEREARKLTQQAIATRLDVNRSVINRQLTGIENITVKSVVELAWAMGWETKIEIFKPQHGQQQNDVFTRTLNKDMLTRTTFGTGTNYKPVAAIQNTRQPVSATIETTETHVRVE
jgi:hypothetical protein